MMLARLALGALRAGSSGAAAAHAPATTAALGVVARSFASSAPEGARRRRFERRGGALGPRERTCLVPFHI